MARARRGDDGRYHGDLPCAYCGALLDQKGRRRVRRYCGPGHRSKKYFGTVVGLITALF
ncbi:hypothetical protein ACFTZ8_21010 [Streptomyces fungicidicus]|uniref:hypothetical protein n=1 Tax=Streptomyces TaxID=1883 RepID=UPI0001B4C54D|nr:MULTISPECIES: hypothetical protein [Streptomyces]QKW02899.1 hypothetical protein HUT14_25020 [Streptomyces sp. NA02536]TQL19900.1 hypothetical protein FBY37_1841 [Streptomyces sp. SLBN-134]